MQVILSPPADWPGDEQSIRAIRERVFIDEQGIPAELEWDGLDPGCAHLLAYDMEGNAIATARMQANGISAEWRYCQSGAAVALAVPYS